MKRNQFIKFVSLSALALSVLPHLSFTSTSTLSKDQLIGKGNPKLFGNGYNLREAAHLQFLKMKSDALKADIKIEVVSSYRNFAHQKRIWDRKFKSFTAKGFSAEQSITKIIEYSTIPGTSRHHWGTDLDIIDANVKRPKNVLLPNHFYGNGPFCKLKEWMDTNAKSYGFYLVYTDNANRKGFKHEPWHFSYKPLSQDYLKQYRNLDIGQILKTEQLLGSEKLTKTFISKYSKENILDINPELL